MSKKEKEFLTGISLGLIFGILVFGKLAFGAPISKDDQNLIAATVQAESGNQCFEGRRMVAAVVLNRLESEDFPNTVEGVLSQDGQFCTYKNLANVTPTWKDQLATQMEIEERSNSDVMFFRAGRYGCGEPLMKIGDHYFSTSE